MEEIINEANEEKSMSSKAVIFYQHIYKWLNQPERQGKSWIDSIVDNSRDIYDIAYDKHKRKCNSNLITKFEENLESTCKKGCKYGADECGVYKGTYQEVFNLFSNFNSITDIDQVYNFLIENINQKAKNVLKKQIDNKIFGN